MMVAINSRSSLNETSKEREGDAPYGDERYVDKNNSSGADGDPSESESYSKNSENKNDR